MKRWLFVGLAAVLMGVLASVLLRVQSSRSDAMVSAALELPRFDLEAEITAEGFVPYRIRIPKDRDVHLIVRAGPGAPEGNLVLLGYEDMVKPTYLGPGQGREIVFSSTRPGDDFGFALEGKVVGRVEITGGHLEEGHQ
ncbi:MAG TPA: hypothetical protein VFP10_15145 [Candidatus Eisenbacteria bacterium]|nr:hypothetical protein [Candidatus Eisenbacteria bacterium]